MIILINNIPVRTKYGATIELKFGNPLFGQDEGAYSLNITCPKKYNEEIFGILPCVGDIPAQKDFDAEVIVMDRHLFGKAVITEVSSHEIAFQLLLGRKASYAVEDLEKIYINELEIGRYPDLTTDEITPTEAWGMDNTHHLYRQCVAFPWVNTESGNIQNRVTKMGNEWKWHEDTRYLSWQPFIVPVVEAVLRAIGYDTDLDNLKASRFASVIICNTLPAAWDIKDFSKMLPHWSVMEFIEHFENFTGGLFDFDHTHKKVKFNFISGMEDNAGEIPVSDIEDDYKTSYIDDASECKYVGEVKYLFSNGNHQMSEYYSCQWFIDQFAKYATLYHNPIGLFDDLKELLIQKQSNVLNIPRSPAGRFDNLPAIHQLYKTVHPEAYWCLKSCNKTCIGKHNGGVYENDYEISLRPVQLNAFPSESNEREDSNNVTLEIIPVCIDETDTENGLCMFLSPGTLDNESGSGAFDIRDFDYESYRERMKEEWETSLPQPLMARMLQQNKENSQEFYSNIFVGVAPTSGEWLRKDVTPIRPIINEYELTEWGDYIISTQLQPNYTHRAKRAIYPNYKYTFKWCSRTVPDIMSSFFIRGHEYVCSSLSITDSQKEDIMLKGDFYRVRR